MVSGVVPGLSRKSVAGDQTSGAHKTAEQWRPNRVKSLPCAATSGFDLQIVNWEQPRYTKLLPTQRTLSLRMCYLSSIDAHQTRTFSRHQLTAQLQQNKCPHSVEHVLVRSQRHNAHRRDARAASVTDAKSIAVHSSSSASPISSSSEPSTSISDTARPSIVGALSCIWSDSLELDRTRSCFWEPLGAHPKCKTDAMRCIRRINSSKPRRE